jgi:hypothetical protein
MIDLPNIEYPIKSINHWSQTKRSPDYAASQSKEIMMKLLTEGNT